MSEAPPLLLLSLLEQWTERRMDEERPMFTLHNQQKRLQYFKNKIMCVDNTMYDRMWEGCSLQKQVWKKYAKELPWSINTVTQKTSLEGNNLLP